MGMVSLDEAYVEVNTKLMGVNEIIVKMGVFNEELASELKKLVKHHKAMKKAKIVKIEEYQKTYADIQKIKDCLLKTKQDFQTATNQKKKIQDELDLIQKMIKKQPVPVTATILPFKRPNANS